MKSTCTMYYNNNVYMHVHVLTYCSYQYNELIVDCVCVLYVHYRVDDGKGLIRELKMKIIYCEPKHN